MSTSEDEWPYVAQRRAHRALVDMLLNRNGIARGQLRFFTTDKLMAIGLVWLLSDVEVHEFESGGVPVRSYVGILPCGLVLRVNTDRRTVPMVEDLQ